MLSPQSALSASTLLLRGTGLAVGLFSLMGGAWAQNIPTTPPAPTSTSGSTTTGPAASSTRFSCQLTNGQYVVMYYPESQPGQAYAWATPSALGGGWSPERRCNEISRRLESYRPDGLVEMQTAVENGYNTICVTTERVPSCRIVLTVPPGQDPIATRDSVFQNLTVADSGQQTQGVNTFTGNRVGNDEIGNLINLGTSILGGSGASSSPRGDINLKPFLDRADGGTGARLQGGVPVRGNARPSPRLNPGNFR
jgi:hypothetical protein